jgi:hypothetical protein
MEGPAIDRMVEKLNKAGIVTESVFAGRPAPNPSISATRPATAFNAQSRSSGIDRNLHAQA